RAEPRAVRPGRSSASATRAGRQRCPLPTRCRRRPSRLPCTDSFYDPRVLPQRFIGNTGRRKPMGATFRSFLEPTTDGQHDVDAPGHPFRSAFVITVVGYALLTALMIGIGL